MTESLFSNAVQGWMLFGLGLSILLHFINLIMWKDDRDARDFWHESLMWEEIRHDETVRMLDAATDVIEELGMEAAYKQDLVDAATRGTRGAFAVEVFA